MAPFFILFTFAYLFTITEDHMRKAIIIPLVFALWTAFSGCRDEAAEKEKQRIEDSLKSVAGELSGQLNEKEAALQEFINSFNEIQENLNTIKEKEKIVTSASTQADVKSRSGQIKEDIQAIYDLMEKNKTRINSLSQKLKNSNLKLQGMQKMVENLQLTINQKDEEINQLKNQLEGLNIELSNLNTNYKTVEAESAQKTEALNTAYYAIGTSKELKEKKVISKEGGFIGLGKTAKVSDDVNKEYFTRINIEQTKTINLGAKKVKVLSTHPKNSYKLVGEKPVEKLEITDPKEFWSNSKYLVIMIE
jgi:DNA repair exonuclease SbcCD ATPase subunit